MKRRSLQEKGCKRVRETQAEHRRKHMQLVSGQVKLRRQKGITDPSSAINPNKNRYWFDLQLKKIKL